MVIGAGNGGLTAAATLAGKGMKTLLIEQHNLPGGLQQVLLEGDLNLNLHFMKSLTSDLLKTKALQDSSWKTK